jgi:hypothetical protein
MDWKNILLYARAGVRETSKGSMTELSSDPLDGALLVQQGGKLRAAALAGRLFTACNTAIVTTTIGAATTWTGLGVANPTGSGIKIIVHEFNFAQWLINTGEGILALATTTSSGFAAAITPRNRAFGGPPSGAYVDDGATIVASVVEQYIASLTHGAADVDGVPAICKVDLNGSLVLLPGRSVVTYTDIVQQKMSFGFMWEEIPL